MLLLKKEHTSLLEPVGLCMLAMIIRGSVDTAGNCQHTSLQLAWAVSGGMRNVRLDC